MKKYIDTEKLIDEIERRYHKAVDESKYINSAKFVRNELEDLREFAYSLQQESTPDIDALHTELINLLKKYRIGEETARTMADRIADTYGAQRYMDGLCDGLNKEDTKKEQPGVDLEKELKNERTKLLDAFGPMNGEQYLAIRNFARHFYELDKTARKV